MSVVVGPLARRRTVRRLSGEIIDMSDDNENGGGVIIAKGRVVNEQKVIEINQKQKDKEQAGKAESLQIVRKDTPVEERNSNPSKSAEIEKRVDAMEGDIKQILKILTSKK